MRFFAIAVTVIVGGAAGLLATELPPASPKARAGTTPHRHTLARSPPARPPQFIGGAREEWPALELGAWLARAHGLRLRLLGVEAAAGRRDASRALAGASLALQRFAGISAETALVPPGATGVLGEDGAAIVASLPRGKLDATRRALLAADTPVLLVHGGLRPGGLAPDRTMTRFSWSLASG
jgi:hypothetical protein